jgi:glycosyltransferase involved in cell wall biosynthesis
MTALAPGLSLVIPAYNSESTLPLLFRRLRAALPACARQYEVIVVNDGSRDGTWSVIQQEAATDPNIQPINLMRNYGQHNALLCGIRAARYDVCVTIDDDLQHPPEEIPRLLSTLSQGFDVVYGTPKTQQHGIWRNLASTFTKLALQGAMGAEVARNVSAFRAFRTQVRDAFADYHGPFVSIDVLLTWGTNKFGAVPVRHDSRAAGTSNYTLRMLIVHALNMMTGFTVWPLQLASLIGFFFTLFGIGVLILVIGRAVIGGGSVPGFPFLASVIAIFSGAQLFALGIIGEYLARMHARVMDRPPYAVRQPEAEVAASEPARVPSASRRQSGD